MGDIFFYSDTDCLTQIADGSVEGASDGTCTQFDISSFGSFEVRSLGPGCVVTVYGNDIAYCSSNKREVVALGSCISNSTVNQFSVDGCSDQSSVESSSIVAVGSQASTVVVSASASAVGSASGDGTASGSTTRTSVATTTTTGSNGSVSVLTVSVIATAPASSDLPSTDSSTDSSTGLSTGAKAGIGVGAALAIIALIAVIAFFVLRRKKKSSTLPVHSEEKEFGSTLTPAPAPAPAYGFSNEKKHHELPTEGRPLSELPPRAATSGLAEAPGDSTWAAPQEMEAGKDFRGEHAELSRSMPRTDVKNR